MGANAKLYHRVAVVTGGNSGVGLETVRALALAQCHVILCSRSFQTGEEAAVGILEGAWWQHEEAAQQAGRAAPLEGPQYHSSCAGCSPDRSKDFQHAATAVPSSTGRRGRITVLQLDLADLASIYDCAQQLLTLPKIDYLILNAGVMGTPLGRTRDGFELQMGVNHLGHFYLTHLLLPKLKTQVHLSPCLAGLLTLPALLAVGVRACPAASD